MEIQHRTELPALLDFFDLPKIAVEVGVAEGYNSADLLTAGIEKLYMVDAWQTLNQKGDGAFEQDWHDANFEKAKERVSKFGDKAVILRGLSTEMCNSVADNSLGLVYIDCDHSYDGVMNDLKAWWPKVVEGGIIAGHDYLNTAYGVYDAVKDFTEGLMPVHLISENKHDDAGFYFIKKTKNVGVEN